MPGTPPTSVRFGAPRYSNGDGTDFAGQVNAVTDVFDALGMRIESGLLSARPNTGPGIANRGYRASDTGQLFIDVGGASPTWVEITPKAHAASHAAGGLDALSVTEAMNATGATGPIKGLFSAYRNAASSLANGAIVPFDTEEIDVSSWFDVTTNVGRYIPQIAGWYRFSWLVSISTAMTVDAYAQSFLRKNGTTALKAGQPMNYRNAAAGATSGGTAIAQANGTTDFFEIQINHSNGGSVALVLGAPWTFFQAQLIGRS